VRRRRRRRRKKVNGENVGTWPSSDVAAVHTAGEQRRRFQIPDSLQLWGQKAVRDPMS